LNTQPAQAKGMARGKLEDNIKIGLKN